MAFQALIDRLGEGGTLALAGAVICLAFGFLAQRSRFCLRSAVIEFARNMVGAAIGGALFGVGMILARGCSSRRLVLAAQGNLRSMISGLVFAVTPQTSWSGLLSPLRLAVSEWRTVGGGASRDLIARTGIGHGGARPA